MIAPGLATRIATPTPLRQTLSPACALYVPERYESRFSLIEAFCNELREAGPEVGLATNPPSVQGLRQRLASAFVFFNFAPTAQMLFDWIGDTRHLQGVPLALVQWLIDHPLNLDQKFTTDLLSQSGYRLVTVANDDTRLLRLRWPHLQHFTVMHGVPRSALVPIDMIEASHAGHGEYARDIDVLFSGSIASEADLANLLAQVPAALHRYCDEIVQLKLAEPMLSFGQAFELVMPSPLICPDHWGILAVVFRYTTAVLNRIRRTSMLRAMKGMRVTLLGTSSWSADVEQARTEGVKIDFVQDVPYRELPQYFARAKVCVAINPTQFTHAFSERLLLSLAGGCGTITDRRLTVTKNFANDETPHCVELCDLKHVESVREAADRLLRDGDHRISMSVRGREDVERSHLWAHRLVELYRKLGMAKTV
ncbi:MAG: glycosyltransferase [Phycisphaerales bacterium]